VNFCHSYGKAHSKGFKKKMSNNSRFFDFKVGKLYRLTRYYFWAGNDVDWNDAEEEDLLVKEARVGEIVVFMGFKSFVSFGKKYKALSFISADQGGLVYMALHSDYWDSYFERIPDDDQ